jgi:hypothetical protein
MAERKAFLLRLDPAVWAALERLAQGELRSVNAQNRIHAARGAGPPRRRLDDAARRRRRRRRLIGSGVRRDADSNARVRNCPMARISSGAAECGIGYVCHSTRKARGDERVARRSAQRNCTTGPAFRAP